MMLETQFIDVGGATLEVGFAGGGEPVICQSHPFGATAPDFDPVNGWESGMGRLVAINARGVGRSSGREPRDYTFRQHVADLEVVRRHLDVDRWVFWGGSGGGCIALLYALLYPQALDGVIVEYMGASGPRIADDERSLVNPAHPEYQRDLAVISECPRRLSEIHVPMLVVAGRQDPLVPVEHCETLQAAVANAELTVFEESGHGIEVGSADFVRRQAVVHRFLAGLSRQSRD